MLDERSSFVAQGCNGRAAGALWIGVKSLAGAALFVLVSTLVYAVLIVVFGMVPQHIWAAFSPIFYFTLPTILATGAGAWVGAVALKLILPTAPLKAIRWLVWLWCGMAGVGILLGFVCGGAMNWPVMGNAIVLAASASMLLSASWRDLPGHPPAGNGS